MDLPLAAEAERIFRQICDEALEYRSPDRFNAKLSHERLNELDRPAPDASPRWQALQNEPIELQIAVALTAHATTEVTPTNWLETQANYTAHQLVTLSLSRELPLTEAQVLPLLESWRGSPGRHHGESGLARLAAAERLFAGRVLAEEFRLLLEAVAAAIRRAMFGPRNYDAEVLDRIDWLLNPPAAGEKRLPFGAFTKALRDWTGTLPKAEGDAWIDLAAHCAKARAKSRPDGKWLGAARKLVAKIDRSQFSASLSHWIGEIVPDPMQPDYSLDILKGLLWLAGASHEATMVAELGRFCEKCFATLRDIPDDPELHDTPVALGKAAIWALSTDQPGAAAELFRLREAIKKREARKLINTRLAETAKMRGLSVEQLEDRSLPASGLDQDSARQTQLLRLEQSWIEDRSWTVADWEKHFFGHPLRRSLVAAMIWQIGDVAVMPEAGELRDVTGRGVKFAPDDRVRLWHPFGADPQHVLAWRARLLERGLTQPIKQVDREVYELTDAERKTRTYSNRFAAQIMDQHRFKTLCEARGWTYTLMGVEELDWVDPAPRFPRRFLPAFGIKAFFHVRLVPDGQFLNCAPLHIGSDEVEFVDRRKRVLALDEVVPIVFSEMLRDIGLFVAGAGVGSDSDWVDCRIAAAGRE
jgi:hypothetical protein